MALHAQFESLKTHIGQPGIKWAGAATKNFSRRKETIFGWIKKLRVARNYRPTDDGSVPAEIFGRRVNNDIRPQAQRALAIWRGEGVVDDCPSVICVSYSGDFSNINYLYIGVCWRFEISYHCLWVLLEGRLPLSNITTVNPNHIDAIERSHFLHEIVGIAIEHFLRNDRAASFQSCH